MRLCDMREKEVINMSDCKRLGCVTDLVFDECEGCIQALVVPAAGRFCGLFGTESEYVIPFDCVKKIGPDIIMVEICEEKFLKSCKDQVISARMGIEQKAEKAQGGKTNEMSILWKDRYKSN